MKTGDKDQGAMGRNNGCYNVEASAVDDGDNEDGEEE